MRETPDNLAFFLLTASGSLPGFFLRRLPFFLLDTAPNGCSSWFGWPAAFRRNRNLVNQIPKLGEAVGYVSTLVAESLAANHELAFHVDSAWKSCRQSFANIIRQTRRRFDSPTKRRFCVHFVDILTTRAAAFGEREVELTQRNCQTFVDDKHRQTKEVEINRETGLY